MSGLKQRMARIMQKRIECLRIIKSTYLNKSVLICNLPADTDIALAAIVSTFEIR